jgi:hypothetical protein
VIRPGPTPRVTRRTQSLPPAWVRPERISGATVQGLAILTAEAAGDQRDAMDLGVLATFEVGDTIPVDTSGLTKITGATLAAALASIDSQLP